MSQTIGSSAVQAQAEQGTLSAIAREATEARGMVEAARAFPREEAKAFITLDRSCKRIKFANKATYSFPRGGAEVSGPSVQLAREAARVWGNVTYGIRIVSDDDERVHLQGWAWDMETNARVTVEDKFRKLIQRKIWNPETKQKELQWIEPDERDLRELINRRGALAERNAILKVLPTDLIEDAQDTCAATILDDSRGQLGENREETIKALILAFSGLAVTPAMLEEFLGYPLEILEPDGLATLRKVYRSLKDGNSRRGDHFNVAEPKRAKEKADELTDMVKGRSQAKQETPVEEAQEGATESWDDDLEGGDFDA